MPAPSIWCCPRLAHNAGGPHIYAAHETRNRIAGCADRPSPHPVQRCPRQSAPSTPLPHTARLPCGKAGLVCLAYIVGARFCPADRRHERPRASQGHPLSNAASRNLSSYHGQTVARPIRRAGLPAVPRPGGLPSRAQKSPRPKVTLEMRARRADASSFMPYFAVAWRRAMLALMHSTMPTARTPTIAVTQAAKSLKCRAGIPMSRPTT